MEQMRKFFKKTDKKRVMARYFLMKDSMINISNETKIAPTTLYKWKLQFAEEFKAIARDRNLVQQYLKECQDLSDIANATPHSSKSKKKKKTTTKATMKTTTVTEPTSPTAQTGTFNPKTTETISSTSETGTLNVYTHRPIETPVIQTKEEKRMMEMEEKIETQNADLMFIKNTFLSHLKEVEKVHQTWGQQIITEKETQLQQAQIRIQQLENEVMRLKTVISTLMA